MNRESYHRIYISLFIELLAILILNKHLNFNYFSPVKYIPNYLRISTGRFYLFYPFYAERKPSNYLCKYMCKLWYLLFFPDICPQLLSQSNWILRFYLTCWNTTRYNLCTRTVPYTFLRDSDYYILKITANPHCKEYSPLQTMSILRLYSKPKICRNIPVCQRC